MSLHQRTLRCAFDIHKIVSSVTVSSAPAALCGSTINHYNVLNSTSQKRLIENAQIRISPLQSVYLMTTPKRWGKLKPLAASVPVPPPLDLTEDNVRQVLADARAELGQIFDNSVGITGKAELADLDGPFVKISLKGRFWHKRSTVLARVGNYLRQRIPEILEVDIEDEKQLDDSPENF